MKCHYCGEEVAENQSYCMWCGTRQEPAKAFVPNIPEEEPVWKEPVHMVTPEEAFPEISIRQPVAVQPVPENSEPVRMTGKYLPRLVLPTGRGLGKMIFLGILTAGIYPLVIWSRIVTELNIAASRYDGRRTMPYLGMMLLAPITLGIYPFVWMHKLCSRIGEELQRRGLDYKFGPGVFWLWGILGSLIIVGPFIFGHKLLKSMNKINADFNAKG